MPINNEDNDGVMAIKAQMLEHQKESWSRFYIFFITLMVCVSVYVCFLLNNLIPAPVTKINDSQRYNGITLYMI